MIDPDVANLLGLPITLVALYVLTKITGSWIIGAAIIAAVTLANFYSGNSSSSRHHQLHSFYEPDSNRHKVVTYYDGGNNYTHQPAGWV